MLTVSPAQAGELKRKTLNFFRALLTPVKIIGQAFYVGSEVMQEHLETAIQRDKDKEFNEAAVKQSSKIEEDH